MISSTSLGVALLAAAVSPSPSVQDRGDIPAFALDRPEIRSGEPVLQFNGNDLSGFYTYLKDSGYDDPKDVFSVVDGMLRISGEEFGGIITDEEFENYHLIIEWRWGPKTFPPRVDRSRDSGLLLHCVGEDGAAGSGWMESIECQIIEGGCGDFIMVGGAERPSLTCVVREGEGNQLYYDPVDGKPVTRDSGRYNWWGRDPEWKDVINVRGPRDVESPAGEWTTMEVICDGATITNIVNGYVVNVGTEASLTKGKILLQSEGAELHCRRFEVRPILRD
ncbi:DUF1080 domain-containing protein [Tautonia sp. JC769]|uniref:3-keto-disaccharide hydrolase n=1 Tax=Tautonia sp. JC769 TaxID=3232135 RepID=UPI00345A5815